MLTQTVQTAPVLPVLSESFIHLVTLIHRSPGKEESFKVVTASERFSDVMREVAHQKFMGSLRGYD
jgi:hypothetical protein